MSSIGIRPARSVNLERLVPLFVVCRHFYGRDVVDQEFLVYSLDLSA